MCGFSFSLPGGCGGRILAESAQGCSWGLVDSAQLWVSSKMLEITALAWPGLPSPAWQPTGGWGTGRGPGGRGLALWQGLPGPAWPTQGTGACYLFVGRKRKRKLLGVFCLLTCVFSQRHVQLSSG